MEVDEFSIFESKDDVRPSPDQPGLMILMTKKSETDCYFLQLLLLFFFFFLLLLILLNNMLTIN